MSGGRISVDERIGYAIGVFSCGLGVALAIWAELELKTTAAPSIAAQVALYSRPLPQHFDGHDLATAFALKGCASLVTQLCQDDVTCDNAMMQRCFYP